MAQRLPKVPARWAILLTDDTTEERQQGRSWPGGVSAIHAEMWGRHGKFG
ncbi:hypothetical protein [Parapedobacter sp.]